MHFERPEVRLHDFSPRRSHKDMIMYVPTCNITFTTNATLLLLLSRVGAVSTAEADIYAAELCYRYCRLRAGKLLVHALLLIGDVGKMVKCHSEKNGSRRSHGHMYTNDSLNVRGGGSSFSLSAFPSRTSRRRFSFQR